MRILAHPFTHVSANRSQISCNVLIKLTKPIPSTARFPPNPSEETQVSPPPQWTHVDSRPKHQKSSNLNSPQKILFVKQRKSLKFLQNKKVQLATQFSVRLRVLPFSDQPPKFPISQKLSRFPSIDQFPSPSRRPIIKGLRTDLIFFVTRFNITHFPIYFFIQDSF
jgi:hypothetical protein